MSDTLSYTDGYYINDTQADVTSKSCGRCSFLQCSSLTRSMDVLSMIKHSIISDEANPISRYFDIHQHVASCGPEMIWKIHDAVRIEDQKECSVFVFEKKIADKLHKPRRREIVSEILRKEVQYLHKLRHPKILSVIHPLEECHNSLAFATEPVVASLANYLGNHERMPVPVPSHIKDRQFLELEIKYGILQITEALSYLHAAEQMIHRNICPQSVIVTRKGNWKLSGFCFAERLPDGKEQITCQPWSTKQPKLAQPNLNYIAPETQVDKKSSTSSDIFSLGMTICCIYNGRQPLIIAEHNPQTYLKQLDQLTQQFGEVAHKMPMPLVEPVEKMINKDTRYRPSAQLFSLLKYFHDPVVSCLQRLDNIEQLETQQQKSEVYQNLIQVIPEIHRKVLYGHVLPALVDSCQNLDTIFMALPAMIALIESVPASDYASIILPQFRFILVSQKPIQATVYLLDKLDIILAKSPEFEIKNEIIPLVFNTLDSNCIQAQEVALGSIRLIKDYLDDNIMKNTVLPRAKSLYNKSDNIKMRINALTCIDHVLDSLDKMMILDEVLPFLMDITLGQDAKIVMAVVGIYKHLLSDKKFGLSYNLIATKVMPPLIPQTVNPGLSMEQFSALMEVLREMLEQVDRQRRNKMKAETVTVPIPQRGLINMQAESKDGTRNYLSVDDAKHGQKSRTVPSTPEALSRSTGNSPKHKTLSQNASGGSLDEALTPSQTADPHRRLSLAPPISSPPMISLPDDGTDNRRRLSAQSLGPFTFSVSLFGDSRRSSLYSNDASRRSSDRLRRPSTHSVGILPIASFGETLDKPRKSSTHSLGKLPFGWDNEEVYPYDVGHPRRPSGTSLYSWINDGDRRGSRGSVFGTLGLGEGHQQPQRRASFQALGESVMQLFSNK